MNFNIIDNNSKLPIYKQLALYFIDEIKNGNLQSDRKLPSDRQLASIYKVSRNTINATLDYLQAEGFIVRIERKGTFVASKQKKGIAELSKWDNLMKRGKQNISKDAYVELAGNKYNIPNLTNRQPLKKYNFANYLFNHLNMSEIDTEMITKEEDFDRFGLYSLRESICEYMKPAGIVAKPDEILIFTSVTQILNMIANAFLNIGINYYHEKYSFITLKNIMSYSGANFKPLEMDDEGINIDTLKRIVRPIKNSFLHIQPCDHNPTGKTVSLARRKEIVDFCENKGMPIIEMDTMRNLYHKNDYPIALKSLDNSNNVLYIGSFLRPTSHLFNLTWLYADKNIINRLSRAKLPIDIMPSPFIQLLMDTAIRKGVFNNYLELLRGHLADQLASLNEAMTHYLSDYATWDSERSAYYLFPKFEKGINTKKLYNKRSDIDFNPGYFYYPNDTSHISITTLSMSKDDFPMAIERLRNLITKR